MRIIVTLLICALFVGCSPVGECMYYYDGEVEIDTCE